MDPISPRTPVFDAGGVMSPTTANTSVSGPGRMLYTKPNVAPSTRLTHAPGQMGQAREHALQLIVAQHKDMPLSRR